jgi:hypothetical protein
MGGGGKGKRSGEPRIYQLERFFVFYMISLVAMKEEWSGICPAYCYFAFCCCSCLSVSMGLLVVFIFNFPPSLPSLLSFCCCADSASALWVSRDANGVCVCVCV